MRNTFAALTIVASFSACSASFSDEDIKDAQASIRDQFSKSSDVSVEEVQLIRESPRKLTGFVRLKIKGVDPLADMDPDTRKFFNLKLKDHPDTEVTKTCTDTMGDDRRTIWRCE